MCTGCITFQVSPLKRKASLKDYEQIEHQISQQSIDLKGKYL